MSDVPNDTELLPCPWCEEKVRIYFKQVYVSWRGYHIGVTECQECGFLVPVVCDGMTLDPLKEAWNKEVLRVTRLREVRE